jgi:phosphohistidine phosphatase
MRPGSRDSERRLTPDGERDAEQVGDYLRQTFELLKLGDQLDPDRVEIADLFYNAGGDTLLNAVRELPDDCQVALLIGHAPAAPGLVHELTDAATSNPEAVAAIESRFPAAALAKLELAGDWSQFDSGSLIAVRLPGQTGS